MSEVTPAVETVVTPAAVEKPVVDTPAPVAKPDKGAAKEALESLRAEKLAAEATLLEYKTKLSAYEKSQADAEAKAAEARGEYQRLYESEKAARATDLAR